MLAALDTTPPRRVLLVDDHEVVRSDVKALLQATDDVVVSAESGSVREAIDEADRARPDVVVVDVRLADGSGIEATREIRARHPDTRVIMLTSFADDEALFASIMGRRIRPPVQAGAWRRRPPRAPSQSWPGCKMCHVTLWPRDVRPPERASPLPMVAVEIV